MQSLHRDGFCLDFVAINCVAIFFISSQFQDFSFTLFFPFSYKESVDLNGDFQCQKSPLSAITVTKLGKSIISSIWNMEVLD